MGLSLDRKLLREVTRLKGQVLTIALVLASGITSFISLRGTYASLEWSRAAYYDRYRFAHVFAGLERAPEWLGPRLEALPGVARVQTRISEDVTVPIEGLPRAAYGRVLSLPTAGEPATNAVHLIAGRTPLRGRDDEVVLLQAFADAHGLAPGHHVPVVINRKLRQMRVVGVAMSPEYIYAVRPGSFSDDPKRFAVLWMERSTLAAAFNLDGAFNDVSLRLQPEASSAEVRAAVERLLKPYGCTGAIDREHQISHKILTSELEQLASLAGMVPVIFLGVAAFLMNLVLARLVALQRSDIAALKAVGYKNREIAGHYLGIVAIVMVPGAILGVVGGYALGHVTLGMYKAFFRIPDLVFRSSLGMVAGGILTSAAAAGLGALIALRAAVRLPPAEAMRPPAPARYRRGVLDRVGLAVLVGPAGVMVVREAVRRPLRLFLSSIGVAGAIALVILGRFGMDSLDRWVERSVRREQRHDLAVSFSRERPARALSELAHLPGVLTAEPMRAIPVRITYGTVQRDILLTGLEPNATLRQLVDRRTSEVVALPRQGLLASAKLREVLGIDLGTRVRLEVREGERRTIEPVISGFVDDAVGLQVYARSAEIAQLLGDEGASSSALLRVDPRELGRIEERLRRTPWVIDVTDLNADIARMRATNEAAFDVWTTVSVTLAAAVIFGVVYNNARISLAVKSRELASLRVLGFSRREISAVLLGGLALEVALAIPLGLLLGRLWTKAFARGFDNETFRFTVAIAPKTYLFAVAVALAAAAASGLWVRRSLDRLDLIGVLKTRE